jgi:PTH1 family peptidyl-tRNA hydrolase
MKLIIGLGNPGKKYERTRHNAGFHVVDELAERLGVAVTREKCRSQTGAASIGTQPALLAKPQTYMNDSGSAVAALLRETYSAAPDLIVIHDDLDLPPGIVRVKTGGGHGGHNGLRSIIEQTGTPDFIRVRVGIGRPEPGVDPADYVLSPYAANEREGAAAAVVTAAEAVITAIEQGATAAMHRFNTKP